MLPWVIGIVVLVVIGIVLEREVYFYEGAHLGPRVQAWLYDRWAAKYDEGKHDSQQQDVDVLARPLIAAVAEVQPDRPDAFMLDVATGTGRLLLALLSQPEFAGRVIALDFSYEMLAQAAQKVSAFWDRVDLLQGSALALPFPDAAFDVVACMEALELMPDMETPLAELARVLRPGGILLTTRGTEESGRTRKIVPAARFTDLLHAAGFEQVEIIPWWKSFDRVWARKRGTSAPIGAGRLTDVLRCQACKETALQPGASGNLVCAVCGAETRVTPDGIVIG